LSRNRSAWIGPRGSPAYCGDQIVLRGRQVRHDHGHGLFPPGEAAQVRLVQHEVASGQVHPSEHGAHLLAMRRVGRQVVPAEQAIDHRRRLALEQVQDDAVRIGLRIRHRNGVLRQVLHQVQVERQLLGGEPLEQRQHVLSAGGVDEVVGILDAGGDAGEHRQLADPEPRHESGGLVERDLGEDSHRARVRS